MRTTLRLTLVGAVAGAVTLVGAPGALAQEVCAYPFDCPEVIDGGTTDEATEDEAIEDEDTAAGGTTGGGTTSGGTASGGTASGVELPMTGGETLLLGMTGLGALVGGTALVVAGRRRVADA